MKKGKTLYLWIIILIFIILWIPYFQNFGGGSGGSSGLSFFSLTVQFTSLYPWLLFFGVIEGALIMIYLKSLVDDLKKEEPKKFDL